VTWTLPSRHLIAVVAALVLLGSAGGAAPSAAGPVVPRFRHVVVVVFENKSRSEIVGNTAAPTFALLRRRYAEMTSYDAVTHPSLPNYLALVSGSTRGIRSDCTDCVVDGRSLADTLVAAGRSWKTYAEGLPRPGFTGAAAGLYAKKHDPFVYFRRVLAQPAELARVVPYSRLAVDLARHVLPDFSLIVPNLCDDMHDCAIATGDAWMRRQIVPLLGRSELANSVVFVVFDEGSDSAGGGGNVEALALGPLVRPGARFVRQTSHYGLLRTIEEAWGLQLLGQSAHAQPIVGIWR
jgi:phosphatidylinositol-3-phosphatase